MLARLLAFTHALRDAGVPVAISEDLDALRALAHVPMDDRDAFRAALGIDAGTWSRGRGWALWKALISLAGDAERGSPLSARPLRDIERILAD